MTDLFPAAVAIVLDREGVLSDDKNDPGGETWFGIARAFHPHIPWPPTREQAIAIYRAEYWDHCRCGELPWPLALAVFDGAVQHAPVDSVRMLQAAAKVGADGVIGAKTIAAASAAPLDVLGEFMALRVLHYAGLPHWKDDRLGWMRRLMAVTIAAAQPPVDLVEGA